MPDLPIGTVTFLFTDIEGSTKLLQRLGDQYREVIAQHGRILREAIAHGRGMEVGTEGDAFFAVFPSPSGALDAAVHAQRGLAAHPWPEGQAVRVRMGLHTGRAVLVGEEYMGLDIHLAARIAAAAHGGQILVSEATRPLVGQALPEGVSLRELGRHRLKDIEHPTHLWDVVIEGLPAEFPAIRSLEARPTNLPRQRTSFVGREREVAEVTSLLAESRLVTMTGPGGSGKTRLALQVAADHLDRFSDGVFFADLGAIVDPALVPAAIARALIVREEPGRDLLDTLADHVRDRNLLLVLDNSEQVIESGVTLSRLLEAAPGLTVLATSRIPFRISGERPYAVPPLALPAVTSDLDMLARSEAVILFTERAATIRPGFRLTAENASVVAEITTRLDGLPLAIELAAGRLNVLTPESLLDRLGQRLALLSGGARDVPERQRTLRATIEWSHDLLGSEEQRLFARLGAFSGGWTLEAAESVCDPGLGVDVLDGLAALMDNSMVRSDEAEGGEPRFGMLETIREFAVERLSGSGEESELRRRHAEHYRDLAEAYAPAFFYRVAGAGPKQGAQAARLDRENDNLRTALGWSAAGGDVTTGLRIALALNWFWQHRGHFAEGRGWLERLLDQPGARSRNALRARALLALGDLALWQAGGTGPHVRPGHRDGSQRQDMPADHTGPRHAYQEAVEIARELNDSGLLAVSLLNLSDVPPNEHDYFAWAAPILEEGVASAERADDRSLTAELRAAVARIDMYRGDYAAALEPIRDAIAVHQETGALHLVSINLNRLGFIEFSLGELEAGQEHLRDSLRMVTEAGNVVATAVVLTFLGLFASRTGRHERAARLFGAVERVRDDMGGGPSPSSIAGLYGDIEGEARQAIGDEAFERMRAEGYAMGTGAAVSYALEDRD